MTHLPADVVKEVKRAIAETQDPEDDIDIQEALENGFDWITPEQADRMLDAAATAAIQAYQSTQSHGPHTELGSRLREIAAYTEVSLSATNRRALLQAADALSRSHGQQEVDCERCQGNGEIVTDWGRYVEPNQNDIGDEAVAECPDCDGTGKVSTLPNPQALREATIEECASVRPPRSAGNPPNGQWGGWYQVAWDQAVIAYSDAIRALSSSPDSQSDRMREALRAIVEFCDDPNGSESGETLAVGLCRLLPAARQALPPRTRRDE